MLRIVLDETEWTPPAACKTWADLLAGIDEACGQRGTVVTAARLDGVDQPAFRQLPGSASSLEGVACVEFESASPRELLAASIAEASRASQTLADAAEAVGARFRGVDVSSASQDLSELARGLGSLVAVVGALSQATGIKLCEVPVDGGTAAEVIDTLCAHADALIAAQQSGDWITVADVIEYDIAPSLRGWPSTFDALQSAVARPS